MNISSSSCEPVFDFLDLFSNLVFGDLLEKNVS